MLPRLAGARFFFDEAPLRAAGARFFFDELPLDAADAAAAVADAAAAVADAGKGSSMEEENIKHS